MGCMAYPKHTLFYSAVLDQVQTRSVVCCGFRYCGARHNPTVYSKTLLHLPRMGIKSNLNKPSCENNLYCRFPAYSDGNAQKGKMCFTIIVALLRGPRHG